MVFSSSQSSPYRSQDTVELLLPGGENPSKNDLGKKQKSLYVSLNMFDQSVDSWALWKQNTSWSQDESLGTDASYDNA